MVALYRLRWQVELFFKELKSFCSLKKLHTSDPNIVQTLVWSSLLTLLLKRFIALGAQRCAKCLISTHNAVRSSATWVSPLLGALLAGKRQQIRQKVRDACQSNNTGDHDFKTSETPLWQGFQALKD